mmetsp:Transcript_5991/g.8950  ORF Transcript_5991/g.8950 Transcript_5991/m.8950 type:complete len:224 (+) Transcript_5991:332-1003(+)
MCCSRKQHGNESILDFDKSKCQVGDHAAEDDVDDHQAETVSNVVLLVVVFCCPIVASEALAANKVAFLGTGNGPVLVFVEAQTHITVLHVADSIEELPFGIVLQGLRRHKEGGVQPGDLHATGQHYAAQLDRHEKATAHVSQRCGANAEQHVEGHEAKEDMQSSRNPSEIEHENGEDDRIHELDEHVHVCFRQEVRRNIVGAGGPLSEHQGSLQWKSIGALQR